MSAVRPAVRITYTVTKLDGGKHFFGFEQSASHPLFFFFGFWSSTLFFDSNFHCIDTSQLMHSGFMYDLQVTGLLR